jgi:hypothetical protein
MEQKTLKDKKYEPYDPKAPQNLKIKINIRKPQSPKVQKLIEKVLTFIELSFIGPSLLW